MSGKIDARPGADNRVTVVIPVFNGEAWVADAIRSVQAQRTPREIVVVDDGSTDETPTVLARFQEEIVVIRQPNRGLSAARNEGIRRATGELLLFLDADDLQPPGYVDAFVDTASQVPDAEVFHCAFRAVDLAGRHLYAIDTPLPLDRDPFHGLLREGSPHIGALCLRRSAIDRAGLFDETLEVQEDWDYWLRLALSGARFHAVDAPAFIIRRRPTSLSGMAGSGLAFTGLAVAERHFAAHLPCPLCPDTDRLDMWRRAALLTSAHAIAARLPGSRRLGRLAGMGLTVLRNPRLAPTACRELGARLSGGKRLGPEHFQKVADVYCAALTQGESPTQAVADAFGRPYATAARWVWQARHEAHTLDPVPAETRPTGEE